jgi:FkbM family methyltransferase
MQLAVKLGPARLRRLESLAQNAQGKGWGAMTVTEEVAAVRELLADRADQELVVFDVGANVGAWTHEALRAFPQARIYCFEPSVSAFAELTKAVGTSPRVSLNRLALAETEGEALLYANTPGSGLGSLTKRRLDHFGLDFSHQEPVPVQTLQSWAASAGVESIDVLKLDVEGHELDVLRGAGELLSRVRVIQFEFGGCNIDTRTYFQDYWYILSDDFELYRLGPAGPSLLPAYSEQDEVFTTTNFLARRRVS